MPQTYKILGQAYVTPNTLTNVYVTGASTQAVINSLYICNQDVPDANVTIVIRPINEVLSNKHYFLLNELVDGASTYVLNLGITIGANTIVAANTTYRTNTTGVANVSYGAFGIEIT